MARNDPQMNLRVPMELKERIEKAALDNGRTITAEAVYRLEESFEQNKNSFDQGYESALNHAALAIASVLSKKNIEWTEIQRTALFMLEETKNIKKAP